jgi:hypothetical protein
MPRLRGLTERPCSPRLKEAFRFRAPQRSSHSLRHHPPPIARAPAAIYESPFGIFALTCAVSCVVFEASRAPATRRDEPSGLCSLCPRAPILRTQIASRAHRRVDDRCTRAPRTALLPTGDKKGTTTESQKSLTVDVLGVAKTPASAATAFTFTCSQAR